VYIHKFFFLARARRRTNRLSTRI